MEHYVDWESIFENIKYLDKDLDTIELNELLIEEGVEVSENVLSLKNLAPGFRTYKKLTKDDILIDIEKAKCMLRRSEEKRIREERDEQEKVRKNQQLDDLRILHGLDTDSEMKLHLEDDPMERVPFIEEVRHMNLCFMSANDLKTLQTRHNKKDQNETFIFIQNLRSFPAKMAIFLGTRNISPYFYGPSSLWENYVNKKTYVDLF